MKNYSINKWKVQSDLTKATQRYQNEGRYWCLLRLPLSADYRFASWAQGNGSDARYSFHCSALPAASRLLHLLTLRRLTTEQVQAHLRDSKARPLVFTTDIPYRESLWQKSRPGSCLYSWCNPVVSNFIFSILAVNQMVCWNRTHVCLKTQIQY